MCVKGVPHYRENRGSFSNSHLWKQEKWELAEKQPPPRGVLPCSAQWSQSQNQKEEILITWFRRPHLSQCWPFWGADVWQIEGTKSSLCLLPAFNSYLLFCDDISYEEGTVRSFLDPNPSLLVSWMGVKSTGRKEAVKWMWGSFPPCSFTWRRMKRPGRAQEHFISSHYSSPKQYVKT